MTHARMRLLLAALLMLSGAAFAIGSSIERSQTHTPVATPTTHSETGGETGAEGGTGEATTHTEANGSEKLFGINPESTGLVAVGVVLTLGLAACVWFWWRRPVLVAVLLFAIAFTALDVREAVHQSSESRTGLLVLAVGLAILHGAVAAVAAAGLATRAGDAQSSAVG